MSQAVASYGLYNALKEVGLEMPKECRNVRLLMENITEPMILQFDCYVTPEDLVKLGKALETIGKAKE